jgi:hypothetical protein
MKISGKRLLGHEFDCIDFFHQQLAVSVQYLPENLTYRCGNTDQGKYSENCEKQKSYLDMADQLQFCPVLVMNIICIQINLWLIWKKFC